MSIDFLRFHFSLASVSIEKIYQTLKTLFDHISKHLCEVRQKYSDTPTLFSVFGILDKHGLLCFIYYKTCGKLWRSTITLLLVLRNLYYKRDARNNYTLPRTVLQKIQNILDDVTILRKKHLDRGWIMGNDVCQSLGNQALREENITKWGTCFLKLSLTLWILRWTYLYLWIPSGPSLSILRKKKCTKVLNTLEGILETSLH